ncbi:unnamed protein product, partial [Laminaria digitata]
REVEVEVPGELLLSAVMADVDKTAGRRAGVEAGAAPMADQTVLTPSARAAYAAVAGEEEENGGADFARDRGEASAVSALGLSSATEEGGNDAGEALVAGAGAESLPTPASAQKQRRSSLLGRAKRSLSSKKNNSSDKGKDKEVPLSSLGIEATALPSNSPMTPGSPA